MFDPAAQLAKTTRFAPRQAGKWWLRLERWGIAPDAKRRQASEWCQLLEAFGLMPMSGEEKERTLGQRILVALSVIPPASQRRRSRAWQVFERRFGYRPSVDTGTGGYPSFADILAGHTVDAKPGRKRSGTLTRACGHRTSHEWTRFEQRRRIVESDCEACVHAKRQADLAAKARRYELKHALPALQAGSPQQLQDGAIARNAVFDKLEKELKQRAAAGENMTVYAEALALFRAHGARDAGSWIRMAGQRSLTLAHVLAEAERQRYAAAA
jgi:hypothetical protein